MTSLREAVQQAIGQIAADVVVKGAKIFDVITGETYEADIAINGERGMIVGVGEGYEGTTVIDGTGLTAVPGFIDCHLHVESSMITPLEFDRCVLPQGTTTAMCDPHEMTNVLGTAALHYFIDSSEHTVMDLFVNLSSCVPATPLETSGAELGAKDLVPFRHRRTVIGLAEFMDIGGVMGQAPGSLEKLEAFEDGHVDGHMPAGVCGRMLDALATCGICNCHETETIAHAREKLRKGIQVFIREGTVCKNAEALAPLATTVLSPFLGMCTDDRNPLDIAEGGHMDCVIRKVIANGGDVLATYRMATWSAAQGFGLHKNTPKWRRRGLLAPGYQADIVLLQGDLKDCKVAKVIKRGKVVTKESFAARTAAPPVIGYDSIKLREVTTNDLKLTRASTVLPVIKLLPHSIETLSVERELAKCPTTGELLADVSRDILKLAVFERHGRNGNIGRWFVEGFGIKNGAIASSVGHDSHNVTVVGSSDEEIVLAVNHLRAIGGGVVVTCAGAVIGELPLPIAGIMSDKPFEEVHQALDRLKHTMSDLRASVDEPLMHMLFLPLCVIPKLKLTDFGPVRFDPVGSGDTAPVLLEDQRVRH